MSQLTQLAFFRARAAHLQAFLKVAPALVYGAIELRRFTMTSMPAEPRG